MADLERQMSEPLLLVSIDPKSCDDDETPKLLLNNANLNSIVAPLIGKKLSIVCLAGPPKLGKSLVFGYMVKYLEAAEKDDPEWIDWDAPDAPLDSFQWRSEDFKKSPDAPGIWCFNRPFIFKPGDTQKKGESEESAILLLYTQLPGQWSTDILTSALLGCSIFSSSMTIMNVYKKLDEKCLDAVSLSIRCALLGVKGKFSSFPFQNGIFLIRDWNFPTEYPFGVSGANKYLKLEKLPEKMAHSKESRLSRQTIIKSFKSVTGCLLPYPGNEVLKEDFSGNIGKLEQNFVETLKDFIENVVNPDELISKRDTTGQVIDVSQWKTRLQDFIRLINGGEILEKTSDKRTLKLVGVKLVMLPGEEKRFVKSALQVYKNFWMRAGRDKKFLTQDEMNNVHRQGKRKALEALENGISSGRDDGDEEEEENEIKMDKRWEMQLKQKLDEYFLEFKKKNQHQFQEHIEKVTVEMICQYEESILAAFPEGPSSENQFRRESQEIINNLKEEFAEKLGGNWSDQMENFLERLKQVERNYLEGSLFQKSEQGESIALSSKNSSKISSSTVDRKPRGNSIRDENCHSKQSTRQIDTSQSHQKSENSSSKRGPVVLDGRNKASKRFENERSKEEAKTLILRLKNTFIAKITSQLEKEPSLESLEKCKQEEWRNCLDTYDKESPPSLSTAELQLCREILEDDLKLAWDKVKSACRQLEMTKLSTFKKLAHEAVKKYEEDMTKLMGNKNNVSQDDLEREHLKIRRQAVNSMLRGFPPKDKNEGDKIREQVEKDIDSMFGKFKEEKAAVKVLNVQNSVSLINTKKREFSDMLKTKLTKGKISNQKALEKESLETRMKIITSFKMDSPIRDDAQLLGEHTRQLEKYLDEVFGEVEAIFLLKSKGNMGAAKMASTQARHFYIEEMDKFIGIHESVTENELADKHKKVSTLAINKLGVEGKGERQELEKELEVAFIKYRDEVLMNMNEEPAIGIDLGTTFSCASIYRKGEVKIIPNSIGKLTTPSYVLFMGDGNEIIGEEGKMRAYENPEGTIFDAKRILGRKFDDPKLQADMKLWPFCVVDGGRGVPMIEVNGKRYYPEEISAKVLAQLKKDAEAYLKRSVTKAVVTVPAYFTDGQKQATIDAGKMAGLDIFSIITEPVAAAMAYKLQYSFSENQDNSGGRHILIFDLGGGTFDVAILKAMEGNIEVVTIQGDTHLGGEDFDQNMMYYCAEAFKTKHRIDLFEGKDSPVKSRRDEVRRRLKRLQGECEIKKIALTTARTATVKVNRIHEDLDLEVKVSRATFEEINQNLFDTTIKVVEEALGSAKLKKSQIDDIVLVGGSTRIPKVQKMLQEYFNGKTLDQKINPDEAVAHGAGLYAAIRQGNVSKESKVFTKIQNITPMPIGVEVYGGGFSPIIPKSTKIPVMLKERYRTAHNNQTSVQITIYEGEDPIAVNNKHLGDFYLNGIPPRAAGEENIDVEMVINDQGILHVRAKCSSTGLESSVTVTENKQRMGQDAIRRYLDQAKNSKGTNNSG